MNDSDYVICTICTLLVLAAIVLGIIIGASIESGPKFCPVCGEEYSESVQYCKYDGTELMMKGKH